MVKKALTGVSAIAVLSALTPSQMPQGLESSSRIPSVEVCMDGENSSGDVVIFSNVFTAEGYNALNYYYGGGFWGGVVGSYASATQGALWGAVYGGAVGFAVGFGLAL